MGDAMLGVLITKENDLFLDGGKICQLDSRSASTV